MTLALKIIPPIQLIISAGLMYGLAKYFPQYHFDLSLGFAIVILLILMASVIGILALYDFHKHQTTFHPHTPEKTSTVVDSGLFAYSRNPMYISLVLLLLAVAVYLQNYTSFVMLPLFIWYLTQFQIIPEEKMLNKLFPNEYQAYCQKVRRWL
ncbi:MAG: isoprenylcysteine carboxylmethyltransferase family protein [Colwellia sp.]|nr:isoprenylcysteine carboxylmethyltransferase family protein [Colwellia sp.]MCW9080590.1 isoprenylcysteine carboxylmethyltransferase family protein [Colwellia sp.]